MFTAVFMYVLYYVCKTAIIAITTNTIQPIVATSSSILAILCIVNTFKHPLVTSHLILVTKHYLSAVFTLDYP